MSSIDQQFIEYIVKSLVGNPDAVKIERRIDEKGVLLELTVDQEDLGRVIGKRGATAQSLRTLLRALGTKNDARYNLKIIDVGGPHEPSSGSKHRSTDDKPVKEDSVKPADDSTDEPTDTSKDDTDDSEEVEEPKKEHDHSDAISKTRAELADLDDLDV